MSTQEQVFDAVRRLSIPQQRQLAERIIREIGKSRQIAFVPIKRLEEEKQRRLDAFADKNTEGRLIAEERREFNRLVAEAGRLAIENAQALVRAQRPDLFDEIGRPSKRRLRAAVRAKARRERPVRNDHR